MLAFVTGGSGFLGRNLIPYLKEKGWKVRALARSEKAADAVKASGAEPAHGDITSDAGLVEHLKGCDAAFHCAAWADDWGDLAEAWNANVAGTERLLTAAKAAGVKRFVHVSTEAVLVGGKPIVRATEDWPYPVRSLGLYTWTKREAEKLARAASTYGFDVMSVRPRFIWGRGDTTLVPRFVEARKSGALKWIAGARYLTSTCHVRNVCEGMLKAAEKGAPGEVYFLTDGDPIPFREIITRLLEKEGVDANTGSIPGFIAHGSSIAMDAAWRLFKLKGRPPLPHASFHLMGEEVTVVDAKARKELGYSGEMTVPQGLAEIPAKEAA